MNAIIKNVNFYSEYLPKQLLKEGNRNKLFSFVSKKFILTKICSISSLDEHKDNLDENDTYFESSEEDFTAKNVIV